MLIIDAHEDIAWNMASFGRDFTRSAAETRRLEAGGSTPARNDDALLGYPEYLAGRVAVVVGSLFAAPLRHAEGEWEKLTYADDHQAHRLYMAQIDLYHRLADEHPDHFRLLRTRPELDALIAAWQQLPAPVLPADEEPGAPPDRETLERRAVRRAEAAALRRDGAAHPEAQAEPAGPGGPPVGLVIGMEGADAVRRPEELELWYERGLRSVGPAWVGTRYSGGSREPGPLTAAGFELLERMAGLNLALDVTHMDEQAVLQALDVYPGTILASHSNALALLRGATGNRHLPDRVLHGLIERDALVCSVPFNAFLKAGWRKGDRKDAVSLERLVDQIDYVCQAAGDARHAGIGTDFDGGFGWQSTPVEIDSIADLQKLVPALAKRGYTEADIAAILSGNLLDRLRRVFPERL
ncbi:MAG: dipeptidase [Chloroflexota bacterium]